MSAQLLPPIRRSAQQCLVPIFSRRRQECASNEPGAENGTLMLARTRGRGNARVRVDKNIRSYYKCADGVYPKHKGGNRHTRARCNIVHLPGLGFWGSHCRRNARDARRSATVGKETVAHSNHWATDTPTSHPHIVGGHSTPKDWQMKYPFDAVGDGFRCCCCASSCCYGWKMRYIYTPPTTTTRSLLADRLTDLTASMVGIKRTHDPQKFFVRVGKRASQNRASTNQWTPKSVADNTTGHCCCK